ncbi:hypothetical protein KCP73_19095 [Salmonella enterica subsp. enterica]|nr:hypothetical protein KCP73_19095 [Salmonella enterica subsp. enterica]
MLLNQPLHHRRGSKTKIATDEEIKTRLSMNCSVMVKQTRVIHCASTGRIIYHAKYSRVYYPTFFLSCRCYPTHSRYKIASLRNDLKIYSPLTTELTG